MAPAWMEHTVKWLSVYVYRGVPLLTLSMHLIISAFSESRRREGRGWKRLLVWVAYQLTNWGPAYVIANQYLETSPREKMIIAFWVPFLLLHHARADNISAYTIEDSELWIRLIVSVLPKSVGSIIVVYRFILSDCAADWPLRWASGIMLFLGIWKYLESAAALWLSNLGHIRDWLPKKQIDLSDLKRLSKKLTDLSDLKDDEATVKEKDDEALLVAHGLFEICKGAFCDYTVEPVDAVDRVREVIRDMFFGKWEIMCTVAEMELSLMYDILYSKAAVVHTFWGYAIRLASPPLTATALLLFVLHCKEGMTPTDEAISYILLSTTFLLDVRWLFRALASSWAHSYFKHRQPSWLRHGFWCQERWKKLRGFVVSFSLSRLSLWLWACECGKETKSYRRWAGTFGQRNLLDQCAAGNKQSLHSIPRRLSVVSGGHLRSRGLESEDLSRGHEIPDYVKKLVFGSICGILFPPVGGTNPNPTTHSNSSESGSGGSGKGSKAPTYQNGHGGSAIPVSSNSVSSSEVMCPKGSTCPKQPRGTQCLRDGELPDHCTCVSPVSLETDSGCLGPPCPRERICNCRHDEPPPWLQYPRGWICTGVGVQAAPWPQYPRERICISINNEPPRLPCPWQVCAGTRNAPFEENRYNVPATPYSHPEEQAAEDHWRYDYYEQTPPEAYEQAPPEAYESYEQPEHSWAHGLDRFAYRRDMPNTYIQDDDQAKADTDEQLGYQTKSMDSDEDMGFAPELQEVILIWHIATDVFLSCNPSITGDKSIELAKAIKQMSDYMLFLVAKRSEMLPGLKLSSLYENTQGALKKIRDKAASEGCKQYSSYARYGKEELAMWMRKNMDRLKDPDTDIIWEGAQLARVLLSLVLPQDGQPESSVTAEEVEGTVEKLEWWTPKLKKYRNMDDMLEFILDVWVRLLLYTSMRCSRDSHAKQVSRGGELTTLVWMITEHARISLVKEILPSLFPPKKEKTE